MAWSQNITTVKFNQNEKCRNRNALDKIKIIIQINVKYNLLKLNANHGYKGNLHWITGGK